MLISPQEFKEHWLTKTEVKLTSYTPAELQNAAISQASKEFLIETGLPEVCAPFLSFNEKLYSDNLLNIKQYFNLDHDDFEDYYVLGSETHGGDMICINASDGDKVVLLSNDHITNIDQNQGMEYQPDFVPIMFINSSLLQLAQSIFTFGDFVSDVRKENGGISFFDCDITKDQAGKLSDGLLEVDSNCLIEKSFWWFEMQNLNMVED